MNTVAVFCGTATGHDPRYRTAAWELGAQLGAAGLAVVYGGAAVGLMGAVAEGALAKGGAVTGVITHHLHGYGVTHTGLTELRFVDDLHQRKAVMASLADAFVALPGGLGTAEEIIEAISWSGMGLHHKPCALLDCLGFFEPLLGYLRHMAGAGFLRDEAVTELIVEPTPAELVDRIVAAER